MSSESVETGRTGLEVAVIGMAGRFPGARDVETFWENLKNGVESISFFSNEELAAKGVEREVLDDPSFIKAKGMIYDMEFFDPSFFNFKPLEAEVMDPQLRIFYECVWELMEIAGYNPETYDGLVGLYAGASSNRKWEMLAVLSGSNQVLGDFALTHLIDRDFLSTRIAHRLNLRGPAITLKTACSTGLMAIELACRGLLTGQCDIALAGAVSVVYEEKIGYFYKEGMIYSPDGHCRAFDAVAEGVIFSDGAGVVALKRLQEAIDDGDTILAVIKGTASNNDGLRKGTYEAPCIEGQADVIRMAYHISEVDPETITYVETHGTGTVVGDPIEIEGLNKAFNTDKRGYCAIGSVKTNVGHMDTAAGIGGFIKTVLALKHRLIPPSLNFERPNPKIDFENCPFYVNTKLSEWKHDKHLLRTGVSSFGVGGTNVHVVLEEAPDPETFSSSREWQMILVSARSEGALNRSTENLLEYLKKNPEVNLGDLAYTLQVGRKAFNYRRMAVLSSTEEAVCLLESFEDASSPGFGKVHTLLSREKNQLVFMFPGQGAQYVNMGLELYQTERDFREAADRCFDVLKPLMGYDIKEILYPADGHTWDEPALDINQTEITQPVIFVFEYALSQLLMKWGLNPYAIIGHSIGEYVAACLSGVFSLEDGLKLVVYRGRLMQQMPSGAMLSVSLSEEELRPLLTHYERLAIAAVNAPSLCVVSGPHEAVDLFEKELKETGHQCRRLHTSHAFHSTMMDPILRQFQEVVRQVKLNKPKLPYISNVSGEWMTVEDAVDPSYWVTHLRCTVRFADGVTALLREPNTIFVEVGPGQSLSTLVKKQTNKKSDQVILNLVRHPKKDISDCYFLYSKIGELWLWGEKINWAVFYSSEKRRRIPLPTYPFERQRYWLEGDPFKIIASKGFISQPGLTKKSEVTQWFYLPSWKRSVISFQPSSETRDRMDWLFFMDEGCFGPQLLERVKQVAVDDNKPINVVTVHRGEAFTNAGNNQNTYSYTVNPGQAEDYQALVAELVKVDRVPNRIIHLWNVTGDESVNWESEIELDEKYGEMGFYSLVYLAQAIGKETIDKDIVIIVLSDGVQDVTGGENICPPKSTVLGPAAVIPQEYPNIRCSCIDVEVPRPGSRKERILIEQLAEEFQAGSPDEIVTYRNNFRLVKTFEPIRLQGSNRGIHRLKEDGVYLITGGLGGIGLAIAQYLSTAVGAKLILTGRSFFPKKEEWGAWIDSHSQDNHVSARIRKIRELEENGSEVMVFSADVSDNQQMQVLIDEAEMQLGTVNGVIHAAGVPGGGLIQLKTREQANRVMTPKVKGTLVLDRILANHDLDFFILCSSINSILPRGGQVDYYAANAFLDAFACYKNAHHDKWALTTSINWDTWQEVGMAVEAAQGWAGTQNVGHPLLDRYKYMHTTKNPNREIYLSRFTFDRHWVLHEHMTPDREGVVPGTTYLEMVRAAFEIHEGTGPIEINDVQFINPLMVSEGEERDVALILKRQEDSFDFLITSRPDGGNKNRGEHQDHAVGKVRRAAKKAKESKRHEVEKIKALFSDNGISDLAVDQRNNKSTERLLVFGPRWKCVKWAKYGKNQGLSFLELGDQYKEDLLSYKLHPALLDTATAFFNGYINNETAYIPFSYKRLVLKKDLPRRLLSYCRLIKDDTLGKEFVKYNITLMDEEGMELVEIEEFTMLEVLKEIKERIIETTSGGFGVDPLETGIFDSVSLEADFLKDGILPFEGIDVFTRILERELPQVVVSTTDLGIRLEKNRKSASTAEDLDEEWQAFRSTAASPVHERPELKTKYAAPETGAQQQLADIWQEILGIRQVGIHDDFFDLGGDSLIAISVRGRIHKKFNTEVPLAEFFNRPTVKQLAEYIGDKTDEDKFYSITPAEEKEYYPLSPSQRRLYILQQLDPGNVAYNLVDSALVEGKIDEERLEKSFQHLIKRHESFRTSFEMIGGEPVQRIHGCDHVDFEIQRFSPAADNVIHEDLHHFVRPFDLSEVPLMRVGLVDQEGQKYLLMVEVHHTITDGTSLAIIFNEISVLYTGEVLPGLSIQYKDYAEWHNRWVETDVIRQQGSYWLNEFKGEIPILNLPLDFPRPVIQGYDGGVAKFSVGTSETQGLRSLALKEEVTLYMVLFSIYNILLSRLSGQEDIVVGTPTAGRKHTDLFSIIGMFLNTLALRNYPTGNKSFRIFLEEVKQRTLGAFENEDYPFERLVDEVAVKRNLSRSPLFDVMFIFHNEMKPRSISGDSAMGLKLSYYDFEKKSAQYDLTLVGFEGEDELYFEIEYCSELFRRESILYFVSYFERIVSAVLADPDGELSEIEILSEKQRSRLLDAFNDTRYEYPTDKTIYHLFEEQVARSPGHTAVIGRKQGAGSMVCHLSYGELSRNSDQLAHVLKEKGVNSNSIVGVMVERSVGMLVGLLGILKAGGAYLPIDPRFPEGRIKYMLSHSSAGILVHELSDVTKVSGEIMVVRLSELSSELPTHLTHITHPTHLCYVIYTSGSTGSPKGVMVTHRSAVNFITGMTDMIDFSPGKSILALTTISFDIFFLETLLPLTLGLNVVVADENQQTDPKLLEDAIVKHEIDIMQVTPSRLKLFLDFSEDLVGLKGVKELMVGGEAFPVNFFTRVKEKFSGKIYNMYGPTETTIWSAVKDLTEALPEELTIGRPIANTQIYIVDKHMRNQPLGVAGELLIGGDGVAEGYLNNVDLTSEKFIDFSHLLPHPLTHSTIYRTGDLAHWLPNGEIEFLGRLDHQVKIRGYRIELEEIEEQLLMHDSIKEAVVISRANRDGDNYLAAYIVGKNTIGAEELFEKLPSNTELRECLSQTLPHYMVPSYFVPVEKMPLTPNGKIDKKALPEPDESRPHLAVTYAEPGTETEETVTNIWKQILKLDRVGIHDNFFELGGNSLNIIQVSDQLTKVFKKDVPVAILFKYLTIKSFVDYMTGEERESEYSHHRVNRKSEIIRSKRRFKQRLDRRVGEKHR